MPEEVSDFLLCREMHLTWHELQSTPFYVRATWAALLSEEAEVRQAEHDRAERQRG